MNTPIPAFDHCHVGRRPGHGLTLVELMIVLAVLVIVMSVAMPSMSEFTANNRVVATKSAFASAVSLTRSEAAKRGRPVLLRAVGSGAAGNEFAAGWELVLDENGDGLAGTSEARLRKFAALPAGVRLGGGATLAFRASGALQASAAAVYTICRSTGSGAAYTITVMPSGVADVTSLAACP